MFTPIPALIHQALHFLQAGQLDAAEQPLQRVLQSQPRDFDALHMMGVVQAMRGNPRAAVDLFRKAASINKRHHLLHFNLGTALAELGEDGEAIESYRRAVKLAPEHAESWLNLGSSLINVGHFDEAAQASTQALAVNPQLAQAFNNLGVARQKLGQFALALESFDRALALQPDLVEALNGRGLALMDREQTEQALTHLQQVVQRYPAHAVLRNSLGMVLRKVLRLDEALESFRLACEADTRYAEAWTNRGLTLAELGLEAEAEACYRQALSVQAGYHEAALGLAYLRLHQNNYADAWDGYELRWLSADFNSRPLATDKPRWQGPGDGRSVLLWAEQGIGDQILFGSLLTSLRSLPQRVTVALDARLLPLFRRSFPSLDFVDHAALAGFQDYEAQLPLGSLPALLRRSLASFEGTPRQTLVPDASRSAVLRGRLLQPGRRMCGLSWRSPRTFSGKTKNIALEELVAAFSGLPVALVDLQYGDTQAERERAAQATGQKVQRLDEIDNFQDIDGLASLIAACDVVVTTSNTTAHLAGAAGVPTFVLVPSGRSRLWYWPSEGRHTPWYPAITLLRQDASGRWDDALGQLRQELGGLFEPAPAIAAGA
ncbi:MAG: tetratricopeptide repeat protein [Curvibacter sp.]